MTLILNAPRGPGILLGSQQTMPRELYGHVTWVAVYMGSMFSSQLEAARESGAHDIYVWGEPNRWTAINFEQSIQTCERLARANGLLGYIADVETDMTPAQAYAMGRAFKASVGRGFSVGFTSFAGYRRLTDIAEGCDGSVWTLCQIYNQGSNQASVFLSWLNRFVSLFGHSIPLIPTYVPTRGTGPELATPEGYDAFLAKVPASSAVGFYGHQRWMLARVATWRGVTIVDSFFWLLGIPTVAHLPLFYSITLATIIGLTLVLFFFLRKRLA